MMDLELLLFCDLNDKCDKKRDAAEAGREQPFLQIRLS